MTLTHPFFFEAYDIDSANYGAIVKDVISVCDASLSRFLSPNTKLTAVDGGGCTTVTAPTDLAEPANPYHPRVGVSDEALQYAVTFQFEGISSFDVDFEAQWDDPNLAGTYDDDEYKSFSLSSSLLGTQ